MSKQLNKTENMLMIAWVIAIVAMAGSLFYSEVMKYVPCELCWYQRILMYPLVVIYGIAAIKKDLHMALPGLILSGLGMFVSIYHYMIQKVPAMQEAGGGCSGAACNAVYVDYFGFITIPFLAGTAFIAIFVIHMILLKKNKEEVNNG